MPEDNPQRRMPDDDGRLARATALVYVLAAVAIVLAIALAWLFAV